jgi:hypothetical protein
VVSLPYFLPVASLCVLSIQCGSKILPILLKIKDRTACLVFGLRPRPHIVCCKHVQWSARVAYQNIMPDQAAKKQALNVRMFLSVRMHFGDVWRDCFLHALWLQPQKQSIQPVKDTKGQRFPPGWFKHALPALQDSI